MRERPANLRPKSAVTRRFVASVVREDAIPTGPLDAPEQALAFWREVIARQPDHEPDKESLAVILLTARLRPFAWHRVSVGTIQETTAHPREILRPAIIGAAHGFLLVHNHPSGDPTPSRADRDLTQRTAKAAELLQLSLVDHVIVIDAHLLAAGCEPCFSFREAGFL